MKNTCIFQRVERKYFVDELTKRRLLQRMKGLLIMDEYGRSTINSLYLDTPEHLIIRNSLDAGAYKEKLRLRSYGTPRADSTVFLELKKKYRGVVYKRRVSLSLQEAERYLEDGSLPVESQIMEEIDYAMHFYGWPRPAMLIAYERDAFVWTGDHSFRVTFDSSPRARSTALQLEKGSSGEPLLPEGMALMELKSSGAIPFAFSKALNELGILPTSFSKYGTAYTNSLVAKNNDSRIILKGAMQHVSNF